MSLLHRLRCSIDEPYRIRNGFGLSPIRNKREEKALIDFCRRQLEDELHMSYNRERKGIYEETISHYRTYGCIDGAYVEEHSGWYWS